MEILEKEKVLEQYKSLPEDLKTAIFSEEGDDQIFRIVAEKGLSEDQASTAARLSGRVLLGFLAPRDFISALAEELKIDYETARAVGLELNEQIFLPVRDSLRKIHHLETESPSEAEIAPQAVVEVAAEHNLETESPSGEEEMPIEEVEEKNISFWKKIVNKFKQI